MARVLIIDDDPFIRKITSATLESYGYQVIVAVDGLQGLNVVQTELPDAVITDVMMPGIDGYELTQRLRRSSEFAHIPILVLTSQSELEEKLRAFEAGADDFMNKPFEPAELAARLAKLLRWGQAVQRVQTPDAVVADETSLIAVHSLRGGIGCSSLAVNLALGLNSLWEYPTLLLDLNLMAGQAALMLDMPLKRTWADLTRFDVSELDVELLQTTIGKHQSGLDLIAAPTYPGEGEKLTGPLVKNVLDILHPRYEYIVADVAHDFNEVTLQALDDADIILLLLAPEMSSIRAAAAALDTYTKLGYEDERIKLVLNWTFERNGLSRKAIEDALHFPITLVLPFAPDRFVTAINTGCPLLCNRPEDTLFALLEDFAFRVSKEQHRSAPPTVPSPAWQRVNKRMSALNRD